MRTKSSQILIGLMLAVAVLGLSGCPKKQAVDKPPVGEMGNTLNDGRFGTTATLNCGQGKGLNIGGSRNTYTVKGKCGSVVVGGDENKISFDGIETDLTVAGLNNTITYREGNPNVQDLGTGNTITHG